MGKKGEYLKQKRKYGSLKVKQNKKIIYKLQVQEYKGDKTLETKCSKKLWEIKTCNLLTLKLKWAITYETRSNQNSASGTWTKQFVQWFPKFADHWSPWGSWKTIYAWYPLPAILI